MPWVDKDKCIGCGVCIDSCPENAILINNGKASINQDECTYCGKCFETCPQQAIRPNRENPLLRGRNPNRPGRGLGRGMGRGLRRWKDK